VRNALDSLGQVALGRSRAPRRRRSLAHAPRVRPRRGGRLLDSPDAVDVVERVRRRRRTAAQFALLVPARAARACAACVLSAVQRPSAPRSCWSRWTRRPSWSASPAAASTSR
jgi:hypothetical protein